MFSSVANFVRGKRRDVECHTGHQSCSRKRNRLIWATVRSFPDCEQYPRPSIPCVPYLVTGNSPIPRRGTHTMEGGSRYCLWACGWFPRGQRCRGLFAVDADLMVWSYIDHARPVPRWGPGCVASSLLVLFYHPEFNNREEKQVVARHGTIWLVEGLCSSRSQHPLHYRC